MKVPLTLIASILISSVASAVVFEECLRRLENHPQVTSMLVEGEMYTELGFAEMGLPDPQLILGVDNIPVDAPAFDRFLPSSKILGIQQQIPSYSLRKSKSNKLKSRAIKQQQMVAYTLQRLEAYLIKALVSLKKVDEVEGHLRQQLEYYVELEEYLKGQLEAGNPVYGRFSEIDVERIKVEQDLNEIHFEKSGIEAELVQLIGEVPDSVIPRVPLYEWDNDIEMSYPVQIAMHDVCIASAGVAVARRASNPNYGVRALYKQREAGRNFSGDDWFSVQATVSFPLWYYWNQKPKLRAAKAERQATKFSSDNVRRMWRKKLTILASERDIALENISLLKEKKAAISEIVSSAERDYEAGNAKLESVLNAQIDRLTVAIQLAKQLSRHTQLSAEFNSHIMNIKR